MTEEGVIQIQGNSEVINKGASGSQVLSPNKKKMQVARLKKMEQLNTKLRSQKSIMTKSLNSLEKHLTAFEKLAEDRALAARVKKKATEISETLEKPEKKKKEIKKTAEELRGLYYECEKEELEKDIYEVIEKLDNTIVEYLASGKI